MILFLSRKISSAFAERGIILQEDLAVYTYSFEILIATLLNLLALCLIAVLTRTGSETIFYLLGFLPLRQLAGGYHAKNHFRCFLILIAVYGIFLVLIKFLLAAYYVYTIAASLLISIFFIFLYAPVEDENKPLSFREVKMLKQKSRIAITVYVIITGLLLPVKIEWTFALALGILSVALSLAASVIRQNIIIHYNYLLKKQ